MRTETNLELRKSWPAWVQFLQRHRLDSFAVWALDSLGPLSVIGAQLLYLGKPLLQTVMGENTASLAQLLEDADECREFMHYIQEKRSS